MSEMLPPTGQAYWRSLDQLADSPEYRRFAEREFPAVFEEITDPVSRRKFLGLMGATLALTGLAGCRRPLALILPYAKMPEDLLPGVPQHYATVMPFRGVGEGILVRSNEGRPQKIDGNPQHPASLGASHVHAQASILELFDPDRSKFPTESGARRGWDDFASWSREHFRGLRARGGRGLRFLSESSSSPALAALRAEIQAAFPGAVWHSYEPIHRDAALEGGRIAFGRPVRAQLALDQADVILALDCDFLTVEPNSVRHARDFARRRRVASEHDTMNRLYAVESAFSVTGAMADHRLRATHGSTAAIALALAGKLAGHGVAVPGAESAAGMRGELPAEARRFVEVLAKDLAAHRGRSVVLAGSTQPAEVHALAHAMNEALGNVGPVVRYTEEPEVPAQVESIADLARALDEGAVDTLVILGGNPAYDAPADLDFAGRIKKAGHAIRLGLFEDETSVACRWHLPRAHFLEAWGDARGWDGTQSIQQPLIAPLYEGKSEIELLALLLERPRIEGHDIVQELFQREWGAAEFDRRWRQALSDGVIPRTAYAEAAVSVDDGAVRAAASAMAGVAPASGAFEVTFRPDACLWDGRYANNGWLQELPDPMSKLTWDNAAMVSPATARDLGVESGDHLRVEVGGAALTLPAWIQPGQADGSVSLPLGYGRERAGSVGNGAGFNTYALRRASGMYATRGSVAKASGRHRLVTTQGHQVMEGRPLVREATLERYREEPDFAPEMVEHPPLVTLYTDREYDFDKGYQWGMSIDLNTCIGCNACMVGCQSENNIAIVGKDEVDRGREMHWIRVDRYYEGDPDDPRAVYQPVPCMHCENAPCESVCPVNATSHSDEGLNEMTYNRCIGTKYCGNNCPYKVRRFNFFDWNKHLTDVEKMAKNPDVTVRMRGMMEKCTYCVQRINRARITAKNESREIRDGEIRTACQDACPTESIVFGNVRDPGSRVSERKAENRNYAMLDEINTRPRTTYLARIRNPHPELEQA